MPIQDFLGKKSITWPWLVGIVIAGFSGYWKAGGLTPEVPVNPAEPLPAKIVTIVKFDTLTVYKPVLDVDTFISTAPDTCDQWLTRLRAEIITLRDSIGTLLAKSQGQIAFTDSTYDWLKVWGKFHYPDGEGGIVYHWIKTPYFSKPRIGFELGLPLLDFPWAKVDYRYKNNRWLGITAQPKIQDSKLKSEFGVSHRWEF